jgi:ornithine carbamoyltransferase
MPSDFLSLDQLVEDQVLELTDRALQLSRCWSAGKMPQRLCGKKVGLIVDDSGWRNTTAIDLGVQTMGGTCVHIPVSLGGNEGVLDLAKYLDNWFELLAVRTPNFALLRELADAARAPVVNLRTRANHPCEILADLSFIRRTRGTFEGLKVAAVTPAGNIIHSWCEAANVLPISLVQIYPSKYFIDEVPRAARNIRCTEDPGELQDADVIITDRWPTAPDEESLLRFQITAAVLDKTKCECLFLPCPPVTRGKEVTAAAMEHTRCCVYEAKAFLMHAQNALLEWALLNDTNSASA